MMSSVIDAPYINFQFGKVTPALVLCVLYFCTLAIFGICGKVNQTITFRRIKLKNCSKGKRNYIWFSLCGYILLVFVCIALPPFLTAENAIVKVSRVYLQYEPLIVLCALLFLCSTIFNTANKNRHIMASNGIFRYVILFSVGAGIFSRQINLALWENHLVIIVAGILYLFLVLIEVEAMVPEKNGATRYDLISYNPVEDFGQLFPNHKAQAEQIADIIANSSPDPFSICVSGKWGTGKTSIINGAVDLLKKKASDSYMFIRINALELDCKESMFRYLMTQIKYSLREKGVYVGIDSEYKDFIASSAGTITTEAIGTFLQKKLFRCEEDYREQKKNLSEILERAFADGKLVVIVDDIERCDEAVAREYIFLIKEIATMKNCVSVFVTDYSLLEQLFKTETDSLFADTSAPSNSFLDKFFNYKIDLIDEDPENILNLYDQSFSENDESFWSIYQIVGMSPSTWYYNVKQGLDTEIDELTERFQRVYLDKDNMKLCEDKINRLKECRALLIERMQVPRNIVTLYNSFRKNACYCYRGLFSSSSSYQEQEDVKKYIRTRNVGQILLFLSFVNACMPNEMYQLTKKGTVYIHPDWTAGSETISIEKRLLLNIVDGTLFDKYVGNREPNGYLKQEIYRFIDAFLNPTYELIQLCRPFTTQEEEWISAIDKNDIEIIKANWHEMMLMVLHKVSLEQPAETNKWRNNYFSALMKFAERQVEMGEWESDIVFSLFERSVRADTYFATGTGLMCIFWEHINTSKVFKSPSKEEFNNLLTFSNHYAYKRIGAIYRLSHYLIKQQDYSKVEHLQERMLDSTQSLENNLALFVAQLSECIPDLSLPNKGWYEDYQALSNYINKMLECLGLLIYPDVKDESVQMIDAANELHCLERLIEWCGSGNTAKRLEFSTSTIHQNLENSLQYFETVFENPTAYRDRDTNREFADFFTTLQETKELVVTREEIARLHTLITRFITESGYSSLPYRKTLVGLSEKLNTTQ